MCICACMHLTILKHFLCMFCDLYMCRNNLKVSFLNFCKGINKLSLTPLCALECMEVLRPHLMFKSNLYNVFKHHVLVHAFTHTFPVLWGQILFLETNWKQWTGHIYPDCNGDNDIKGQCSIANSIIANSKKKRNLKRLECSMSHVHV